MFLLTTSRALVAAPMTLIMEEENSNKLEIDEKISELRLCLCYLTTVSAPWKKKSDPLEPAVEDLINAGFQGLKCRKIPICVYLKMNDVCTPNLPYLEVMTDCHVNFSSHRLST